MKGNDEMEWNERIGMEMERVSVIEVGERKKWMGMDENEWIQNIDANENEKQR